MLKHIDLQLFAEEGSGVNEPVAAEQENTAEETSEVMTQEQPQTGVEQQPAAGESVERAFAARLAKERERLEAELRQKYESELKSNPHLSYLEQKAQRLGITVEQLIENDRKFEEQQRLNELIQNNIPKEYAEKLLKVDELEQWKAQMEKQIQEEQQKRQEQQYTQQMYAEFLQMYPEVKPEQIPKEVWLLVKQGHRLASAYAIHENKLLKQQFQTQEANTKNAESSTGSVKTQGKTGGYISREQFDANKGNMNWVMKNLDLIEESRKHWK
jgi:hypothetical protein